MRCFRSSLLPAVALVIAAVAAQWTQAQQPPTPVVQAQEEPAVIAEMADEELAIDEELADDTICDEKQCKALAQKVAKAHKPLFYDNDFSYLCDPCYCGYWPGDCLKRLCVHDCTTLDIGGQYRARYHDEHNMRGLGLTGVDDEFILHRTRLYANLEVGNHFRAYAEYIDAVSFHENNNPRPIEENRSDLLNAFIDVALWNDCCSEMWVRAGRQELLYGGQRLISPLDWANTRRTFEGVKGMYQGHGWKIDGFWTNTVDPDTVNFDEANEEEDFMGVYATTTNCCDRTTDLFWLRYVDELDANTFANDFDYHTVGGRVAGKSGCYNYEAWGAYQFGTNTNGSNHAAGAFTLGLGRSFDCYCWKPSVWLYYDWASGGDTLGAGNGFHHLFPLGHKYLGFMDLYGRQNIQTPNVLLTLQPHEKVKLLCWYYYFQLQNVNDGPYSVVMTPYNGANAPGDRELGHEIDLLLTYTCSPRTSILFGYSHFWAGDYYSTTTLPAGADGQDADFFYTQVHYNF